MSQFVGYASVTGRAYDMGWYDEEVSPGAWSKTLAEAPDVQFNLSHGGAGSGLPMARTGRNMTLAEDSHGLRVEADLDDDDPDVALLNRKVKAGLIHDMSMSFQIVRQRWENENTFRRIFEISLHRGDVTVTPRGANPAAGVVSLRSAALAHLRTPGRDTARQRQTLVEQLGKAGVLEIRSVNLNGVDYDLTAEPAHAGAGSHVRLAVAPVVLPDHTTRAQLALARARAGYRPAPSRGRPSLPGLPDATTGARRALAAARAKHRR